MKVLLPLFLALAVANAPASEEEFAVWSSVEVTTTEIPHFGKVDVTAKADNERIAGLKITAFGKTHTLDGKGLEKISGFPLSSMRITHEAGYEELGGYTMHIKFRRTYYDSAKKLRDETAVISVSEKNGLMAVDVRDTK
jgi:hypothetical protein